MTLSYIFFVILGNYHDNLFLYILNNLKSI